VQKVKVGMVALLLCQSLVVSNIGAEEKQEKLRDPTRPLGLIAQKEAGVKLELQAVFIRDNSREAVINGRRVNVGDNIFGALVVRIDEKSVTYRKEGKIGKLVLRDSVFVTN
jgi:hypothetical protein